MAGDKREQIVEAAYALFRREGYHAVGVDRIIADAGVAKMTMYRHFPSKDGLIAEVLRVRAERFDRQLDRLLPAHRTAAEKVAAIVGWYERWFARPDFHGCAFAHALAEFGSAGHPVFAAVLAQKESFRARLQAILEAAGEGEAMVAGRAASAVFMLFEGATLLAQTGRQPEAIEGLRTGIEALLARRART